MKTLLKIFFFMAVISLVASCDTTDVLDLDDASSSKKDVNKTVTMGFNLVFTGTYDPTNGPNPICGDYPPYVRVINRGEGTGTHFGKVISYFDFCVDVRDNSYPNGHLEAYFEDENGDRLFVELAGFVVPGRVPGMPSYATSYFKDPFVIMGGTGRFEGATGSGMTNDYNSSKDLFSHHHWKGKITMLKKNKK